MFLLRVNRQEKTVMEEWEPKKENKSLESSIVKLNLNRFNKSEEAAVDQFSLNAWPLLEIKILLFLCHKGLRRSIWFLNQPLQLSSEEVR